MTDFGAKLRQAREARGISLRQIAASTKISVAALEALERNDISKLPGGIFSRAFVRSYAAEVGLDPDATVREFLERFDGTAPDVHHPDASTDEYAGASGGGVPLALKIVAAVVLIALVLAYFILRRPAADVATDAAEPAASAPAQAAPVATTATAAAAPQRDAAPASPPAAPASAGAARPMQIELHPAGPCWVRVVADGKPLIGRVMNAGERQTVTVQQSAVVDFGDAAACDFTIDGRPGRPLGGRGEVKTMRLTRETVSQYVR